MTALFRALFFSMLSYWLTPKLKKEPSLMILITTCAFPCNDKFTISAWKRSPNNLTTQETIMFLPVWCLYITEKVESFYNLIYHTKNFIALDKHMLPNCIGPWCLQCIGRNWSCLFNGDLQPRSTNASKLVRRN